MSGTPAASRCDVAVVGGGILGLACALRLAREKPRLRVELLEREARVGRHQSSHNSGVIDAGVYYAAGPLKAKLCREGADLMYAFCAEEGIPVRRIGKLIVARERSELARLDALEQRARANQVPGLRRLDGPTAIAEVEPSATGVAALQSPATGVVDYGRVCEALAARFQEAGGKLTTNAGVEAVGRRSGGLACAMPQAPPWPGGPCSAPELGRTAWRSPPGPIATPASSPSGAPTCASAPSGRGWSGD